MFENLLTRLEKVLDFAERAIPVLAILPDEACGHGRFRREKFISETALLLYAAHAASQQSDRITKKVRRIALHLEQFARSQSILTMMRIRPTAASELAVAHACLTKLGLPDSAFHERVSSVLLSPMQVLTEKLPWKELEKKWFADISGIAVSVDTASIMSHLIINKGLNALSARREETYAFTHALIYLSDFGQSMVEVTRPKEELGLDADCALARCLDDDDFDLAAETLMTWPYLRLEWSSTAKFAFEVLLTVEDAVGYLPSLSLRKDAFASQRSTEQDAYFLLEAYHTVFVMGLLCAACLTTGHYPVSGYSCSQHSQLTSPVWSHLSVRKPVPQWQKQFHECNGVGQHSLTSFLVAVGLRRSLDAGNFVQYRSILALVVDHSLPVTPAVVQGIETLGLLVE